MKTCQDLPEEDNTMELLNEFLRVLKRKLLLLMQVLNSFLQQDGEEKHEQPFEAYEKCKAEESRILLTLTKAKVASAADRRTFDRFCLRIYEQFEGTAQKITKQRLTSVDPTELINMLQAIFGEFKAS